MEKAIDFLRGHRSFIITAHKNPEGDAIGSCLGLARILNDLGAEAHVVILDKVPPNTLFLPGADRILSRLDALPRVEAAIYLDCGDRDRPGAEFADYVEGMPVLNIDHHGTNTRYGDTNWVDPEASSTGEMIVLLAQDLKIALDRESAQCLFTAISTDTGSFQFSNATARALRTAAATVEAGARPELSSEEYYHSRPVSHLKLMSLALQTLEFIEDDRIGEITVHSDMFRSTGTGTDALEGLVNIITDARTAEVAVLYRQTDMDEWKVSMRSKGNVDVSMVARSFGGGGHRNAAGCSISGNLEEVKTKVRRKASQELG